jgi:hypothetical protein
LIEAIVVGEMTKIDWNAQKIYQDGMINNFYYGRIIGFSTDRPNGRLRVDMIALDNFVARTQHFAPECCSPISKIEEFLYF